MSRFARQCLTNFLSAKKKEEEEGIRLFLVPLSLFLSVCLSACRGDANYVGGVMALPPSRTCLTAAQELAPEFRHSAAAGALFNRINFGLSFGSKNHLSFDLRFPTLRKHSKMGSLDMSQNQNGISICFSSRNSSQNFVYWIASQFGSAADHP